jgi:mono/diheme cytochrome c family protein
MSKTRSNRWLAVIAFCMLVLVLAACASKAATPAASSGGGDGIPKPSNPGGTGEAVNLTGDSANGAKLFADNCVSCHGDEGKGGVANPGAKDETVPALNPIDAALKNADAKQFGANIDLFLEHGSSPEGNMPTLSMPAFGDNKTLQPQDIADLIAYVISLNP